MVSLLPPEKDLRVLLHSGVPTRARLPRQKVAFERDNGPADLGGTISFIAPRAEYTLPFFFSESNRGKLVFLAEARPPKTQAALLNPGEPVTGTPAAGPP